MESVATTETEAAAQLQTHGQRRINLIWEITQAAIALSVTVTTLAVAACLAFWLSQGAEPLNMLERAFLLIVGFYFGRTNHTRQGGVEPTR